MGTTVFERQRPAASVIRHSLSETRQGVFWLDDLPDTPEAYDAVLAGVVEEALARLTPEGGLEHPDCVDDIGDTSLGVTSLLALAWQRGKLGVAALVLFAAALGVWVLELVALATQYRDADEFATCSTDCTAVHYVSALAFLAPPLLVALSAAAMLVSLARRIRARRGQARGPAS